MENSSRAPNLHKVASGASFNFIGAISRSLLGFLFVFVLARTLEAQEVGIFFLGLNIIMLVAILAISGLDVGLRRFISIAHGSNDTRLAWSYFQAAAYIALPINLLLSLLLFIFSDRIANDLLEKPELAGVIPWLIPYLVIYATAEILLSVTQGYKHMKYWVICLDLVFNTLRIILVLALSFLGLQLYGAVYAQSLSILIATMLALYYFRNVMPPRPTGRLESKIKEMAAFSLPVSLARLSNTGNGRLETIILGYFVVASDIAIYTVALKIAVIGSIILASLNTVFAPIISQLHAQHNHADLKVIFTSVTRWAFTLSFPVYFLISWYAIPFTALFGEEYKSGELVIIALCLGQMINALTGPSGNLLLMSGHTYTNLWINVAGVLLTILLNILLIPELGILGCAIAVGIAVTLTNITRVVFALKFMNMHPFGVYLWKPLLAGAACLSVLAAAGPDREADLGFFGLGLALIVGVAIYAGILVMLGFNTEDKELLSSIRKRLRPS